MCQPSVSRNIPAFRKGCRKDSTQIGTENSVSGIEDFMTSFSAADLDRLLSFFRQLHKKSSAALISDDSTCIRHKGPKSLVAVCGDKSLS